MQKLGLGCAVLTAIIFFPVGIFCQSNPPASSGDGTEKSAAPATTTVAGIIRTSQGVSVPGATVHVVHLASGRTWVSWTDEDGKFSFPGLPAGRYRLEAKQLNFGTSQLEVYFGGETATEAQLTLHVDVSSTTTADTNSVTKAAPADTSTTTPERAGTAKPAEESTTAATKNGHQPVGQPSAAAASSSKKSHHKGFQQVETKGQPASAEGKMATPAENAAKGSRGSKGNAQEQPLSAAGAAPDDTSSSLGDASSSDAFLMSGTVNRSATLGGRGSFGGGATGYGSSGNFDMSSAASTEEFPLPGQGGSPKGAGKGSGHIHHSKSGQHHKTKPTPVGADSFGQGIEQLWAQHRLSRLSSDRVHFSLVNRFDDSVWDARPYSLTQANSPKIGHHDDKFGARVGGPVYIPHVYDGRQRTFFFASYEFERATQPHDFFATVPTQAERGGDFTDRGAVGTPGAVQLFDPTSSLTGPRTPLGSTIPQNRLDPAALGMLQFIPLPNLPGFVQNFHLQTALPVNSDLGNIKILHTISPKLNLMASYQAKSVSAANPFTMPQLTNTSSTLGQAVTLDLTQNWTSRLINESKINWSRYAIETLNPFAFKRNIVAELGITGVSEAPMDWGVPLTEFTNFTTLTDTVPALHRNQTLRVMDNVAYMLSKHTIRTGAEVRWMQLNTDTNPVPRGQFAFTGLMTSQLDNTGKPVVGTGFDFADFLMGFPQSTAVRFGSSRTYFREREYLAYVQDDWRIHPRFAINLGVRYELATPPVELFNSIADLVMNPAITQVALICASPGFSTSCAPGRVNPFTGKALPRALMYTDANNWSPRVGIAWRPPTKLPLVFRAGYGIFYNESIYNQLALSLANQPPFAQSLLLQTTTQTALMPQTVLTLENGFPTQPSADVTNSVAVDPNYQVGYAQLWNVSLESQLKPSLSIEVTYTGTKGTHLDLLRAPNRATPGSPFNTNINRRISNAPGFTYDTFGASSIYHAVQLLVQRRMAHGLMLEGMYTFGRSIDNASSIGGGSTLAALLGSIAGGAGVPVVVQNDNNFAAERGLSSFDIRQQIRGTFSYELPFGQTKRWLHNGWASAVFGNLQASGLTVIDTGMPFTAILSGNVADNTGTGAILSTRASQIANANLSSGQRTTSHFFNTAAFTIPPPLQFGDASRNTITGPGTSYINFALEKKFRFGQDGRVHLTTRWEVQNLANNPNFAGLETHVNSAQFGRVMAVKPMRTMDLMLRVSF